MEGTNINYIEKINDFNFQRDREIKSVVDDEQLDAEKRAEKIKGINAKYDELIKKEESDYKISSKAKVKIVPVRESEELQAKGHQVVGIRMENNQLVHELIPPVDLQNTKDSK